MSSSQQQTKAAYVKKRRAEKEYHFGWPLRKRIIQKIERFNKALTLGLLGKLMRTKKIKGKLPLSDIKKVLILRTDAIGDMVVTSPLWRILKQANPEIKIGIAGSFRNIDLLRCDPDVDLVFDLTKKDKQQLKAEYKRCREEQYDLVFCCTLHKRTKSAIMAWRCAPKAYRVTTVSTNPERHEEIFSKTIELPDLEYLIPMPVQLQAMLEQSIDLKVHDELRFLSLSICKENEQAIKQRANELLAITASSRFIVFNTESANTYREWGYENNYQLANRLTKYFPDLLVALSSSPNREKELTDYLASKENNKRIHYFPTKDLHELTALIRFSDLVITPDTSVIHLSSAERKPVIGFFLRHNEWLPYRVPARIFIPKEKEPVTTILIEPVFQAAIELLSAEKPEKQIITYTDPYRTVIVPPIEVSDLQFTS